jgi:hypothetical protein
MDAIIMSKRVEPSKGQGKYKILSPWNGGDEEATFQQSKSAPFDAEILIKYPALIDADSSEEVVEYLKEWSDAIALTTSDSVEQIETHQDVSNLLGNKSED